MGESQFGGKNKSGGVKVIGRKGIRQAFQVSMNITGQITVIMAIIASGTVIPPRLFFLIIIFHMEKWACQVHRALPHQNQESLILIDFYHGLKMHSSPF